MVLAEVRCDCGGTLERGTEDTPRGPRWYFACQWCGTWWRHQNGVFGPVGREPIHCGTLTPEEMYLLAFFRQLTEAAQYDVLAHVQARAIRQRRAAEGAMHFGKQTSVPRT